MPRKVAVQIVSGDKYGELSVREELERLPPDSNGQRHRQFLCDCNCGGSVTVRMCNLRSGRIRSCGCLTSIRAKATGHDHPAYKHGESGSYSYIRYQELQFRAKEKGLSLHNDITIESLENFLNEKMPEGYGNRRITIRRKDRAKPYRLNNLIIMPSGGMPSSKRMAYVVDGIPYRTLQDIADVEGCSREWIRQKFDRKMTGYKKESYVKHFA